MDLVLLFVVFNAALLGSEEEAELVVCKLLEGVWVVWCGVGLITKFKVG